MLAENLAEIRQRIAQAAKDANRNSDEVTLVAVSKTHPAPVVRELLEAGHRVFGENRVQEATGKWPSLIERFPDIDLRLIGPLQSNKAAQAVGLFNAIESIDREKIAKAIAKEMASQNRRLSCSIQVNIGEEPQKAGIEPSVAAEFVAWCNNELNLPIMGLMCIPPAEEPPAPYFALLAKIGAESGVKKLSMGMSADYEIGVQLGATDVRVGSALFGARSSAPQEKE